MKLRPVPSLALSLVLSSVIGATDALAASATALASFEGLSVRTDGTASLVFTDTDFLEALGLTDGGAADPFNDGATFDSQVSAFGEGTATNSGRFGASSFATANDFARSDAFTFVDAGIELSGIGNVFIDISYSLAVDTLDNLAEGFAKAGLSAFGAFASGSVGLFSQGQPGVADGDTLDGILTLSFFVNQNPLDGPLSDVLYIDTYASAQAAPVPVPAAVWLFGSAVAGFAGLRRRVVTPV